MPLTPHTTFAAYDNADHLHVKDAGNVAQGNAIPLALFRETDSMRPSGLRFDGRCFDYAEELPRSSASHL